MRRRAGVMAAALALLAFACSSEIGSRPNDGGPVADSGLVTDAADPPDGAPDGSIPDAACGAELCDGHDNDCDGSVDEGLERACTDLCSGAGTQVCVRGAWQLCEPNAPSPEACDDADNDCDGLVDEALECAALKPRLTVLILAGQSNMVGLGVNADLSAADAGPVSQAHIYYNGSIHPNPNALHWTGLAPGFGVLADRFGPELGFGQRLRELWPSRTLAIIKVAEGGTAIDRWAAGSGDLYQLLVDEVQRQMTDLRAEWRPQIAGFVWMQGESDGIDARNAAAYGARLRALIERLRTDIGVPLLPVTAGLIYEQELWPYASTVRSQTSQLAAELGPMNVVETNDLATHAADPAHYDSPSTLALGRRLAEATAALHGTAWRFPADLSAARGDGFWRFFERPAAGAPVALDYEPAMSRWQGTETFVGATGAQPSASRSVEIAWSAPLAARMLVTVSATAPGGGDAEVEITDGEHVLWGPAQLSSDRSVRHILTLDMVQGRALFFRTAAGGDFVRWEIAADVVEFDE